MLGKVSCGARESGAVRLTKALKLKRRSLTASAERVREWLATSECVRLRLVCRCEAEPMARMSVEAAVFS